MKKDLEVLKQETDYSSLLEAALNHISEAVYISSADSTVLFINKEAEITDGINRENIIGRKEQEVYGTSNHQYVVEHRCPILNEKTTYATGEGKVKYVYHSVYPFEVGGKMMGSFSISKDITKVDQFISKIYQLQQELKVREKQIAENGTSYTLDNIIGKSIPMLNAIKAAQRAARFITNVLISGETGTGKEIFAQGIHNASVFKDEPFVGLNCAAIPENLMESTLFGTVKGSYTGAQNTAGLFEQAGKGTLFLDEIDSLSLPMQAKLLRALQEKRIRKIGGKEEIPINCHIISATNINIDKALTENIIRPDIYYRLASVVIEIPPLRNRKGDVPLLIQHFINTCRELYGTNIEDIDNDALSILVSYSWPGNVREMEHMIEGMVVLAGDNEKIITTRHLPEQLRKGGSSSKSKNRKVSQIDLNNILDNYERTLILTALKENDQNFSATARNLNIHRNALYSKMKRLNIN